MYRSFGSSIGNRIGSYDRQSHMERAKQGVDLGTTQMIVKELTVQTLGRFLAVTL